jgi:hypothetical protein
MTVPITVLISKSPPANLKFLGTSLCFSIRTRTDNECKALPWC